MYRREFIPFLQLPLVLPSLLYCKTDLVSCNIRNFEIPLVFLKHPSADCYLPSHHMHEPIPCPELVHQFSIRYTFGNPRMFFVDIFCQLPFYSEFQKFLCNMVQWFDLCSFTSNSLSCIVEKFFSIGLSGRDSSTLIIYQVQPQISCTFRVNSNFELL